MDTLGLLDIAASGNIPELITQLELETHATHTTITRGEPLSEAEKLLDEALWYARHGDLDEATYRLKEADSFRDDEDDFEYDQFDVDLDDDEEDSE